MDDILRKSVEEQGKALHSRRVSSAELVAASLRRAETAGEQLRAVAQLLPERAADQAQKADEMFRRGCATPLTGIPYGIKDLFSVEGTTTRWGSCAMTPLKPRITASVVERLDAAGAVLVAKLSMIELAGAGGYRYASASSDGACLNPWDSTRWSGGSSSGSAAAVAAGIVAFAIGSETGGSISVPAAFCGVTGMRPSWGAVSRYGGLLTSWSLDKFGPIARSAADCRAVFHCISGLDERDPATLVVRPQEHAIKPLRAGILPLPAKGYEVGRRLFDDALRVLSVQGVELEHVVLPPLDFRHIYDRLHTGETAAALGEFILSDQVHAVIDEAQRAGLRACINQRSDDYVRASQERLVAIAELRRIFHRVDFLVAPTVMTEATKLGQDLAAWKPRRLMPSVLGAVAGLPGVTVPMGNGSSGLPLGISFIGRFGHDLTVLAAAEGYQQSTEWHMKQADLGL